MTFYPYGPAPLWRAHLYWFCLFCCTCTSPFETVLITHTTVKLCRCAHLQGVGGRRGGGCEGKCDSQKRRACKKQLVPLNKDEKLRQWDGEACHLTRTHFTNRRRSITHTWIGSFIYLLCSLFNPPAACLWKYILHRVGQPESSLIWERLHERADAYPHIRHICVCVCVWAPLIRCWLLCAKCPSILPPPFYFSSRRSSKPYRMDSPRRVP